MIGCMIESTIGIKAALGLCSLVDYADLDGFLVIDNEPYQQVVEKAGRVYLP
jgi:L-alanine-DL-glutamate epimerase-like enolase superfamily enzyme